MSAPSMAEDRLTALLDGELMLVEQIVIDEFTWTELAMLVVAVVDENNDALRQMRAAILAKYDNHAKRVQGVSA